MKTLALMMVSLFACAGAWGNSNFVGNPDLPYPPACAGMSGPEPVALGGPTEVNLYDGYSKREIPFYVEGFRQACSEHGRSLVWLRITAAPAYRYRFFSVAVPMVWARPVGYEYDLLMRLATGPNGWGSGSDENFQLVRLESWPGELPVAEQGTWTFLLDSPYAWNVYEFEGLTASQYNDAFTLTLRDLGRYINLGTVHIPATASVLQPAEGLPISGRLSGTWVIDGVADQGFVLSVSNALGAGAAADNARDAQRLRVFLTQYTYDQEGKLLWLTGSTTIAQGAKSATMSIEYVQGGAFMESLPARRQVVGTVRIVANDCNDLTLEYDYAGLGLGAGTERLQRVFSLETAGHECRDYEARVEVNR
ncbi:MAG: hypothetical protein HKN58_00130 [Xanthomonadales bacterium]|nr:hypothetical protein [Xanthomonadales bacterium]